MGYTNVVSLAGGYNGWKNAGYAVKVPRVLTPEQLMAGKEAPGERVAVIDHDGYVVGAAVAEHLPGRVNNG